jgi:hypothetical protein
MSNILLAYGNKATGATLSGGQWESLLPLDNLKNGRLGKVARSSTQGPSATQFRFDLAANCTLRALALVNHNLSTGALWRARTTDATLDMDFVGPTSMRPRTLTTSGGANGTRVGPEGNIEAATCPRYDYSPVNLSSGTATQTISSVPAGTYLLRPTGSNAAVMASGPTVSNSGTIGTWLGPTFVVVNATGDVTLTVLSAATAIHFRESLGLLHEEERTNLLTYSAQFDAAAWNRAAETGGSVSAGSSTSPDGGTNADTYTRATETGSFAFLRQVVSGDASQALTFSVYIRAATSLTTQMVISNLTVTTLKSEELSVTTVWQRFSFSIAASALTDTGSIGVGFVGGSDGDQLILWGAQLEAGSFPTTYIPTTSAAVTRTADSVSITGSNFSGFYNQSEGTLYAEVRTAVVATTRGMLAASNTVNESINLYRAGSDVYGEIFDGGVLTGTQTVANSGEASKAAIAYKLNDVATAANGAISAVDTSVTIPTPNELQIGNTYGGNLYPLNGHIRRIAYWPTRRTNAELQSITTTGPDALGLDTGWLPAKQMTFHGDTPANWGEQYPLIAAFDPTTVRYGTVEIEDNANPDGYVELGQLFVAGGFQPEHNAEYQGFGDGRTDLSSSVKSVGGQKYSTARRRPRTVDFNFPILTQDEGDHLDEMMAEVGTTEDVLYVPDPADPAKSQRYGFLGTLRELTPLEYPFFDHRAMPLRLEQKL